MCVVVNKYKDPYDIYIGRGSRWGNPYIIGKDGNREEVINKFKISLWRTLNLDPDFKHELLELDGKVLGCFCKPKACHGDVIASAVEYVKKGYSL